MYITSNHRVRKVTVSTGIITTIGGTGVAGYSGDNGPATTAKLNFPRGIALDTAGTSICFLAVGNNSHRKYLSRQHVYW